MERRRKIFVARGHSRRRVQTSDFRESASKKFLVRENTTVTTNETSRTRPKRVKAKRQRRRRRRWLRRRRVVVGGRGAEKVGQRDSGRPPSPRSLEHWSLTPPTRTRLASSLFRFDPPSARLGEARLTKNTSLSLRPFASREERKKTGYGKRHQKKKEDEKRNKKQLFNCWPKAFERKGFEKKL